MSSGRDRDTESSMVPSGAHRADSVLNVQTERAGRLAPIVEPPVTHVTFADHDLGRYAAALRQRWRVALAAFVVVSAATAVGLSMRAPVYTATGLLEIKPESAGAVSIESLFGSERVATDELETQFGILKSHTLAERVVAELQQERAVARERRDGGTTDKVKRLPRLSLGAFRKSLSVTPKKGSRLVEVSFTSSSRDLSKRVVDAVFDNYLQMRREDAQRSVSWLESQLQVARERLEASEIRLQSLPEAVGVEVLETGKGELTERINLSLRRLEEMHAEARAERIAKQAALNRAREAADVAPDNSVTQSLVVRLSELRREHARLATMYHSEYPAMLAVLHQIEEVEAAIAAERSQARAREDEAYQAALRREQLLRRALADQHQQAQRLYNEAGGYEAIRREVVTNQKLYASLNERLEQMNVSAALRAANVGIVDRPTRPAQPSGTPLPADIGLTLVVGALAGIGAAVVREYTDTSVKTREDVETYLRVPTLAAIPAVPRQQRRLVGMAEPVGPRHWHNISQEGWQRSPLAEAFAALRTSVLLDDDAAVHASKTFLVTSARSEEGKTTVSINLALSLARLHYRVLLVDANMRCPCVHEALDLKPAPGLVHFLTGDQAWPSYVQRNAVENLDVLAGGRPDISPADLLSLPRMRTLIGEAAAAYDYVVIDSPALLASPADVRSLATLADGVLLTIRQGVTPRAMVATALAQLTHVSGVILNRAEEDIPLDRSASAAWSA